LKNQQNQQNKKIERLGKVPENFKFLLTMRNKEYAVLKLEGFSSFEKAMARMGTLMNKGWTKARIFQQVWNQEKGEVS